MVVLIVFAVEDGKVKIYAPRLHHMFSEAIQ